MSTIETIVFIVLCWWMIFFITLPIGFQPDENKIVGQASSAPKKAYIKQKMLVSSALTIIITLIFKWYMS